MTLLQHPQSGTAPSRLRPRPRKRSRAIVLGLVVLLLLTAFITVAGWTAPGAAPVAHAADNSGEQKVAVFEDAVVRPGETWENVVVVGGDLLIQGTVENVAVVVFGDVTIADGARVGHGVNPDDAAVVSVFGDVTEMPGATVRGRTVDVGGVIGGIDMSVGDPVLRPWRTGAILNWVWSTVFLVVVAVVIAAIAPRQVAAVRDRVREHFFSSLGWGALGVIIGVPIVTAALVISIIGIILVVPWLAIVLPIMSLFGLVAVGATVGRLVFGASEDKRETVMLAAVVGVVIINVVRWIPVAWIVVLGVLWLVGFGATYVSIWAWLRNRRRRKREAAAQEAAARAAATSFEVGPYPGGPPVTSSGPPYTPPPGSPAPPPPVPPSAAPPVATPGPQPPSGPEPTTSGAPGAAGPGEGTIEGAATTPGADVATADSPAAPPAGAPVVDISAAPSPEATAADAPAAPSPEVATEPPEDRQPESDGTSSG